MPARRAFPGIGHAVHQSNGAGDCGSRSPDFVLSHLPGDLLTDVTFALSISTNEWVAHCGASLHCQGRSLFRPLDSPGDTGGSLLSFKVGTTSKSDFVSHLIFLSVRRRAQRQAGGGRQARSDYLAIMHAAVLAHPTAKRFVRQR